MGGDTYKSEDTGSTNSSGCQLARPTFMATSPKAKILTLVEAVGSWNFYVSRRTCCGFHAGLQEMNKVVQSAKSMPCKKHFYATDAEQCPRCGVLHYLDESGVCCLCVH